MYIYNQKFLILGVSKSGFSVAKFLLISNVKCFYYDDGKSENVKRNCDMLDELGGVKVDDNNVEEIFPQIDVLVVSPGVPINHKLCVRAKKEDKKIIGELEFGFSQFSPTIVGITGTNGKTTTVSMINSILNQAEKKNLLIGNVGTPVLDEREKIDSNTICVTEISSFQLETINQLSCHIGCVLNIAPDHLERHYTMENYVFLKKRLLKNLSKSEFALLNYDDEIVKQFAEDVLAKTMFVSCKEKIFGAYKEDGWLTFNGEKILKEEDLPIKGLHNIYNALFSIAVCKILGIENQAIASGLKNFKGVKHRLEHVGEIENVKFINDSKSTNSASTITAIKSISNPTVLILGGSDKGEDFSKLFSEIRLSNVCHIVLTGAIRYKMLSCAIKESLSDISVIEDFDSAVRVAYSIAKENQVVLLSPACASYDRFSGFSERGERFRSLVEKIIAKG